MYTEALSEYLQSVARARDVAVLVNLLDWDQDRLNTVPPWGRSQVITMSDTPFPLGDCQV